MDTARQFSLRLAELLRNERLAMAEFLVALSEFDRDRGWVALGYTSLSHYLTRELRLPKGPAFYRMTAAHLIQEFPEIVEPLRDGRLCLSTVAEMANVVTRENLATVLPRFFGASKQEAKEIAAELSPRAVPARTVVRPLATVTPALALTSAETPEVPRPGPAPAPATGRATDDLVLPEEPLGPPESAPRPRDAARALVEPRTAELSRMHVTVTRRLVDKLASARDALSHSHPGASDDEILELGLDLLLDRAAKRRGLVEKPRKVPPPPPGSEHVPAQIWREVWRREGGCCTFPLANGERCGSTYQLELDHVRPKALGPVDRPLTAEDFRIRCKPHNIVEARRVFGDAVMDRFTSLGRGPAA
jgi:hypothetical protein